MAAERRDRCSGWLLATVRDRAAGAAGSESPPASSARSSSCSLLAVGPRAAERAVPHPQRRASLSTWACTSSIRRDGCSARSSRWVAATAAGPRPGSTRRTTQTTRRSSARMSAGSAATISLGRRFPHEDSCWLEVWGTGGYERIEFMWDTAGSEVFEDSMVRQAEAFARAIAEVECEGARGNDAVAALSSRRDGRRSWPMPATAVTADGACASAERPGPLTVRSGSGSSATA